MSTRNLIVDDEFFAELQAFFKSRDEIESMVDSYLGQLKDIRADAVKGGKVADSLDEYITYVDKLKGKMKAISDDLSTLAESYVRAVDQADSYLF